MSHGHSSRSSFTPAHPINQPQNDMRRPGNFYGQQYDRHCSPYLRPPRWGRDEKESIMTERNHSFVESRRGRNPTVQGATYDEERSYSSAPHPNSTLPQYINTINSFRSISPMSRSTSGFRDKYSIPVAPPQDMSRYPVPQIPSQEFGDRPLNNDRRNSLSSHISRNTSWPARYRHPDQNIQAKSIPPYATASSHTERSERPLLEPSQAWKRRTEELNRQQSSDFRSMGLAGERRNFSSNNLNLEATHNIASTSVGRPMQQANSVQGYESRRFPQPSIPPVISPRFDSRTRFPEQRRPQMDVPRRIAPLPTTLRKPLYRQSARISARPRRSPSPTSVSSESSDSAHSRSRRRSRSGSRGSRFTSSPEKSTRREPEQIHRDRIMPHKNSPDRIPRRITPNYENRRPDPSHIPPPPTRQFPPDWMPPAVHSASDRQPYREFKDNLSEQPLDHSQQKSRPPSPSPVVSHSSIRSSVHSTPDRVPMEITLGHPTDHSTPTTEKKDLNKSVVPELPSPLSLTLEDAGFELPGMRFQKDGALKPSLLPSTQNELGIYTEQDLSIVEPNSVPKSASEHLHGENSVRHDFSSEASGQPSVTHNNIEKSTDEEENKETHIHSLDAGTHMHPLLAETHTAISERMDVDVVNLPLAISHQPPPVISVESGNNDSIASTPPDIPEDNVATPGAAHDIEDITMVVQDPKTPPPELIRRFGIAPDSSPLSEPTPLSPATNITRHHEASENDDSPNASFEQENPDPVNDFSNALRVFVSVREKKKAVFSRESYEHIFRDNYALRDAPIRRIQTSDNELVREIMDGPFQDRLEDRVSIFHSISERFEKRSEELAIKTQKSRAEYKAYHERWIARCRKLDQDLASRGAEWLPLPTAQMTRRSLNFGDPVRSDLEMEQIIASLGNEDMTDPNVLAIRNMAIIPDLISTDPFNVENHAIFKDDNGLVEDPADTFDLYKALGRWTEEEKDIFLRQYGVYPKQFGKIASFLPNKTSAQCILFYYFHKKDLINFRSAITKYGPKRKRGRKAGKRKGNALLADIMKPSRGAAADGSGHKHNNRFNPASASGSRQVLNPRVFLSQESQIGPSRTMSSTGRITVRVPHLTNTITTLKNADDPLPINTSVPSQEIRASSSDEGNEAFIVVDDPRKRLDNVASMDEQVVQADLATESGASEKTRVKRPPGRPRKKPKEQRKPNNDAIPTVRKVPTTYVWTKTEERAYMELLKQHGKDFDKISAGIPAKTTLQCRNYFRNHAIDRDLESIAGAAVTQTST